MYGFMQVSYQSLEKNLLYLKMNRRKRIRMKRVTVFSDSLCTADY